MKEVAYCRELSRGFKLQGYQTTNRRLKLLVSDRKEIRNGGVPLQHPPLRARIKSSVAVGTVSTLLNLSISGRGEDGFQSNFDALDTHHPNMRGS